VTEQQKDYIENQLHIIQNKSTIEELNRYQSLLYGASLEEWIKTTLLKACDVKRRSLDIPSAMVEMGDFSDMGGE